MCLITYLKTNILFKEQRFVTKTYDDLIEAGHRYALDGKGSTKELKKKTLVSNGSM